MRGLTPQECRALIVDPDPSAEDEHLPDAVFAELAARRLGQWVPDPKNLRHVWEVTSLGKLALKLATHGS